MLADVATGPARRSQHRADTCLCSLTSDLINLASASTGIEAEEFGPVRKGKRGSYRKSLSHSGLSRHHKFHVGQIPEKRFAYVDLKSRLVGYVDEVSLRAKCEGNQHVHMPAGQPS